MTTQPNYQREIDWYGRELKLAELRAEIRRLELEQKAAEIARMLSEQRT